MRVICIMPRQEQVSALLDDLKNIGYDRKDIIVSDFNNKGDFIEKNTIINAKSEREGVNENAPFYSQFMDDLGNLNINTQGIIVSVETSSKASTKVKNLMKRNGATMFLHE